jgi:hypothetical protein
LILDLAALSLAWRMTAELRLLLNPYMVANIPRAVMHDVAPSLLAQLAIWLVASLWLKTYHESSDTSFTSALFRVAESSGSRIVGGILHAIDRSYVLRTTPWCRLIAILCAAVGAGYIHVPRGLARGIATHSGVDRDALAGPSTVGCLGLRRGGPRRIGGDSSHTGTRLYL